MSARGWRVLALTLATSALACNQWLGIEAATVGCVSDDHCGTAESCLASVCQALTPDAGTPDAGDAASQDPNESVP